MIMVLVFAGLGVLLVLWFRHKARSGFIIRRAALDDVELGGLFSDNIPKETVLSVLALIGESYGIPYSKLRPDDCLITELGEIDSWQLDVGAEKLEKALDSQFGLTVPSGLKAMKIHELLDLVVKRSR